MAKLSIRHSTTYRYRYPVALGPHRLTLRPREGRDLLLSSHDLASTPDARISWATDVFGNAVATATFAEPTDCLKIDSKAVVDLTSAAWPVFDIAASAITYPFSYGEHEWKDLGGLREVQYADPSDLFRQWIGAFVSTSPTDTLSLLKDLSSGVSNEIAYQSREAEGTQSPLETLRLRSGTCRDFAVLFAEAARVLGFGARIVSGYLFNPNHLLIGSNDRGSTHAWVDVFLPGAGWITFDPTNRSMGGANLIPVAVVRDIAQAVPISGGFIGAANAFVSMDVAVEVSEQ
ncbi:transglutaminase family protein [Rhizobium leguminosarum]|uniref:transglutaminase family protein n=1 Tax=Rhizobium leguminosarum TaxID=384 RepID=UPI001C9173B9|nr:transglutaminase family protein [Rhizobium leguminosarum]MBY2945236.1 transglutaminase family protein [Rhizobium leguminosarum]